MLGALAVLAAVVVGGRVILMDAHGFSAREQPSAVERWIARRAHSMALPDNAKALTVSDILTVALSAESPKYFSRQSRWSRSTAFKRKELLR